MNLTETQRQAIAHTKGNLQLIACAGSGKTEVVARFVSNLLNPATERGLAWSDMAILVRSVRNSAKPITQALATTGICAMRAPK
jgi:superfamily I DNA/RNA helicase